MKETNESSERNMAVRKWEEYDSSKRRGNREHTSTSAVGTNRICRGIVRTDMGMGMVLTGMCMRYVSTTSIQGLNLVPHGDFARTDMGMG